MNLTVTDMDHGAAVMVAGMWIEDGQTIRHGVSVPTKGRGRDLAIAEAGIALEVWRRSKAEFEQTKRDYETTAKTS